MNVALPLGLILFALIVAGAAATGVAIVVSRRAVRDTAPRCGKCGYNLTGAVSNRCPECGGLFIDVGVIRSGSRSLSRKAAWGLGLVLVGMVLVGVLGVSFVTLRTRAEMANLRQRALAARRVAAVQAQAATATSAAYAESQPKWSERSVLVRQRQEVQEVLP